MGIDLIESVPKMIDIRMNEKSRIRIARYQLFIALSRGPGHGQDQDYPDQLLHWCVYHVAEKDTESLETLGKDLLNLLSIGGGVSKGLA